MQEILKNLQLNNDLKNNLRGLTAYKNGFVATGFPRMKLYFLDKQGNTQKEIDTERFYGSVYYNSEENNFICGCYSALCCEIHILDCDGVILKKVDTYNSIPKELREQEQFPSYTTAAFSAGDLIFFTLQNSKRLYGITKEGKYRNCIDFEKYLPDREFTVLGATYSKEKIALVAKTNKLHYLIVCNLDTSKLEIRPLHGFDENDIYGLTVYLQTLYGAVGKIQNSKILEIAKII